MNHLKRQISFNKTNAIAQLRRKRKTNAIAFRNSTDRAQKKGIQQINNVPLYLQKVHCQRE